MVCVAGAAVLLALLPGAHGEQPSDRPDPLPLERLPATPERIAELQRATRGGVLEKLSLADFEQRVQRAARAVEALKNPPRLIEARYLARLVDGALTGNAAWRVLNPVAGPAVLALDGDGTPFNLAVRQPRLQNKDALLAEFDGKTLGLLLDREGEHAVALDWTARGAATPAGLHFDLQVPPCAVAALELDLPADHVVTVSSQGCLLAGPFPAEAGDRRLWTVGLTGRSKVHFVVRPAERAGQPAPLLFARRLETRQKLLPDLVQADYEIHLTGGTYTPAPPSGLRALRCELDEPLRVETVSCTNLERWELLPGKGGAGGTLTVWVREPFEGGLLKVRCLAPLASGRTWTSPAVRMVDAVFQGESLELRLHADVQLDNWQAGGFRLLRTATESDGAQVLTLVGGLGDVPGAPPRRPSARVLSQGADFRARQLAWWQVGPEKSSLTSQIAYEVIRGRLFQLAVQLPAGWEVDHVDLGPADLLRNWRVREEGKASTLLVDLQRPLAPVPEARLPGLDGPTAETARSRNLPRLAVRLRPAPPRAGSRDKPGDSSPANLTCAFPDLVPLGARFREGALAIDFNEQLFQAAAETRLAAAAGAEEEGPWGRQAPDYYYPYRGEAVQGTLVLRPRRTRMHGRCLSEVVLVSGHARLETHLVVQSEVGSADTIDLWFSAPVTGEWDWRTRDGRKVPKFERLWAAEVAPAPSLLAARNPLELVNLLAAAGPVLQPAARSRGQYWRLTLAQPLPAREPFPIHGTCRLQPAGEGRWEVPLAVVPGAGRMEGEVRLHLAGASLVRMETEGLREAAGGRAGAASPWRAFRYAQPPVALTLRGQAPVVDRSAAVFADEAALTTYVEPGGRLLNHFRFRLGSGWQAALPLRLPERTLPLRLPATAKVLAVRVDECWAAQMPEPRVEGGQVLVLLPVPVAPGEADREEGASAAHRYEVVYALEGPAWSLWAQPEATAPELPVNTVAFRRTWHLPPRVVPLFGGRYCRVSGPPQQGATRPPRLSSGSPNDWVEWEPIAGGEREAGLVVVRRDVLTAISLALATVSLALAAVFGLAFGRAGRAAGRARLGFLLAWPGVAGLAWLWLPTPFHELALWPFLAGCVAALITYLLALAGERRPAPTAPPADGKSGSGLRAAGAVAGLLALLGAAGVASQASAPRQAPDLPEKPDRDALATVLLVPGPQGAADKQSVLAAPELLHELRTQARQGAAGLEKAVLVSAAYEGKVVDGTARFKAEFLVHAFGDKPTTVVLPLDGVQLEEGALLDGARAYPVAARGIGYQLRVSGVGPHRVVLPFSVGVQAAGQGRDVQFAIPRVAQSRLALELPRGASHPQVVGKQGRQVVTAPDKEAPRLEADLGRVSSRLHVRWREDGTERRRPVVAVKEHYLWNLRPEGSSLSAVLHYTLSTGAIPAVTLDLPEGMEVASAAAETVATPRLEGDPARLRDLQLTTPDGRRQLRLEFQAPVAGPVVVRLELVPRRPFPSITTPLPLPTPREAESTGSFLAYHLTGLESRDRERVLNGVTGMEPAEFVQAWQTATGSDVMTPDYACQFRRERGGTPPIQLRLQFPGVRSEASQEVSWRVGPQQATVRATAVVKAPAGDLALVEWDVPAVVQVSRVSGDNVRSWSRSGSRVQVWLQRSGAAAEVHLTGWLALPAPRTRNEAGQAVFESTTFALPSIRLASGDQQTVVRLSAGPGLALKPQQLENLQSPPGLRPSDQELEYLVAGPNPVYRGVFEVHSAVARTDVQVLTLFEVRDQAVTFLTSIDCRVLQGSLRALTIHLQNWDGEARLEAPGPARVRERRRGTTRTWVIDLEPGVTGAYRLTMAGRLPLEAATAGLRAPDVTVAEAPTASRWLAVIGSELTTEGPQGVVALKDVDRVLGPRFLEETERIRHGGGSAWKVEGDDWGLRLLARARAVGPSPVRVFLAEQSAAVIDGRRWAHEATYWLYHESNTDLNVVLPAEATVVTAAIDGREVVPLQPSPDRLWLPLPGATGARCVRFRWAYAGEGEQLDRPRLDRPRLEGVADSPAVWTVRVPPGYRGAPGESATRPVSAAGLVLRRAHAQVQLSAALADKVRGRDAAAAQFAAAQRRFYRSCREAEAALAVADAETGPSGQPLAVWLRELMEQDRQLARTALLEELRAKAEHQVRAGQPEEGEPAGPFAVLREEDRLFCWDGGPDAAGPVLPLTSQRAWQTQWAAAYSLLLLLGLLAVWGLSRFLGGVARAPLHRPAPVPAAAGNSTPPPVA